MNPARLKALVTSIECRQRAFSSLLAPVAEGCNDVPGGSEAFFADERPAFPFSDRR
jgi:hypothetical protein